MILSQQQVAANLRTQILHKIETKLFKTQKTDNKLFYIFYYYSSSGTKIKYIYLYTKSI